jgi:DNA-binding NarL/FixJ family response regulator
MAMNRIIIVARYPTIRVGLATLLTDDPEFEIASETDDVTLLPELVEIHQPDALLIDLVDEPADRVQMLREMSDTGLLPPMTLLCGSATDALNALTIPDASLLLRDATGDEIRSTIRSARQGLVTLDQRVVNEVVELLRLSDPPAATDDQVRMTPRELDVLEMIADGLPNKSIAQELGISEHTVKFHVGSIFRKLEVSSRSEAIAVAARRGLLVL